ncbi:hypothetical protein ACKLNO_10260 [Neisseriaceae bacterium B1]
MNIRHTFLLATLISGFAQAQTYICIDKGKPIYTTLKLNKTCTVSNIDGIASASEPAVISASTLVSSEVALAQASEPATQTVPQMIDDEISRIWTKNELGSFDDTVILPPAPKVENVSPSIKANVRFPVIRRTAPVVAAPVTRPPQLTRRQLLEQELSREKAALSRAQSSLNVARSQKDNASVRRFNAQVRDRQLNIQALEQEMRR